MTVPIQNNAKGVSSWEITFCVMLAAAVFMLPGIASAAAGTTADNNNLTVIVCNVILLLQGNIARGVAAFGVIFLGFSLFLGKISWGTALALAMGLGAIFGAQALVNLASGGTGLNCTGAVQAGT